MRDGVQLSVDVYRPEQAEKFPALLAFAIYNKDLQGPDYAASLPPQPAWAPLWAGLLEAGDTNFSYRAVTFTSLARRAASESHNPADQENGIATI